MLFLNWQLAAIALLVFPITLIGPRILTPKAVQANYEQKLNEAGAARHGAGKRRGAGGGQGLQPAAQDVRLVHHAQPGCAHQDRVGGVPVDHGGAHRHHLGAAAAPRGAGDRRLSRHQGPDHHRHLRHLRKRVLGGVLQHRPSHALHSGVDPVGRRGAPHAGTAGRADPRRRSARRAGPAAASPTTSPSSASTSSTRAARRRCSTISRSSSMSARPSPSSAPAAPARARCST